MSTASFNEVNPRFQNDACGIESFVVCPGDANRTGQVKHEICRGDLAVQSRNTGDCALWRTNIHLLEDKVRVFHRKAVPHAAGEIVQYLDSRPLFEQPVNQVRTNEACTAGYNNALSLEDFSHQVSIAGSQSASLAFHFRLAANPERNAGLFPVS